MSIARLFLADQATVDREGGGDCVEAVVRLCEGVEGYTEDAVREVLGMTMAEILKPDEPADAAGEG